MAVEPTGTTTLDTKQLLHVLTAYKRGDFTQRMPIDQTGIEGKIADTLNDIIEQNERLCEELSRLSNVVGKEGKIRERASLNASRGGWNSCVESVNTLIADLVQPTTEVARVITSVASGNLTQKMALDIDGRPLTGEFLRTAKTVNTMVDQLASFASEVTRVAREVGTEGQLGGQAQVKGVSGTWKDLTDSVNSMANNLTSQVRNIADVTTAVASGDLTRRITVEAQGEILELKNTINTMVDQLSSFASEVTRVALEVGTEGQLGGRAEVKGVSGTWKDLTDSVNSMANNLTSQVRNIADVTTAVAGGDLTKKITVDVQGEILDLKNTINTMVDQLRSFASEVTRVAREVGTEGQLGGQAEVKDVSGTWKDLTDNVNSMANNLTYQVRNIADVTTAVASGDLTRRITAEAQGEILELKNTINTMVDQLSSFASEVTRVALEVGTEGKLGGRAEVKGVAGTWKDLTDSVNSMANNLTEQVRNIAEVTTAVANGDLSKKINVDVQGEILDLKNTINTMVDQLRSFASEVTRVAREVGTEGQLGGQAQVKDVSGTWKDLTDSVNSMANNLTYQVRNIADVTTAVASGDLTRRITAEAQGEILELKNTINTMVDQLSAFADEVTRVAREVGTEGKLGGRAEVKGVAGTWKDLTDSVNSMAGNLTVQLRDVSKVATAIASGDLTQKITVDVRGEILQIKDVINTMVDQLGSFASEVTRVAREVGTEGKLGGRAEVQNVAGTWKDLTDNVNSMANNLTSQVRNIADVTTAVAKGDLSRKITAEAQGEILELKNTINTMVDQLGSFASEVTRVAREVGTEGKLGGRAEVQNVAGTWKDLTDNVNSMAGNLTSQVRNIADVTTAVAGGDLTKKITVDVQGEILDLKNTINTMVDQLGSFASEVTRVAREVGTEGQLGGQAYVTGVAGTWKDLTDNVNFMASNLTNQVRSIAGVTTAVANGDLSKKINVEAKGEIAQLAETINTMVDQLSSFASEVTRVAREVGTEGKLAGQARVTGVSGIWKDLTDSVNVMASNLTDQVRGIAKVVTAVANGNLKQKLTLEAKGEISELAETINSMIDTLATFSDEVTSLASDVGIEGKLGGQANVPGAAGSWRDLTDNVNRMATTLSTQVREIADVATAVTKGEFRTITVEASGEVEALKNTINEMIRNLRDTTTYSQEQDWLKTNVARFTRILQGQRDLNAVSRLILSELAPLVNELHGVFYINEAVMGDGKEPVLKLLASYGYQVRKSLNNEFHPGEGLIGQCILEKQRILLTGIPEDYVKVSSGLGEASPRNIVVLPVLFEGEVLAVIELATFRDFNEVQLNFLDQLTESIGIVLNTISANMKTEDLLKNSQSLTQELQDRQQELTESNARLEQQAASLRVSEERLKMQQEELQQANEELEEKAQMLSEKNRDVERKNLQIEMASQELQEKAEQLALTSKYKSEFLANMSHELRTPLNSMLILSRLLSENDGQNMNEKQVEYASTIHSAGNDLLSIINEILDLAKIESGTMSIHPTNVYFDELREYVDRNFREFAPDKEVDFRVELGEDLPESIYTDAQRLQQVLRNLLSNAFKFTEQGEVVMRMEPAQDGWSRNNDNLNHADRVIAFTVRDTGIGIPAHRQRLIFEAFQQADGTTSRKYGGTGLGLSISREIAHLLKGEITLQSAPGEGSTFTLYLPANHPFTEEDLRGPEVDTVSTTDISPADAGGRPGGSPVPTGYNDTDLDRSLPARTAPALSVAELPEEPEANPISDDRENLAPDDHVLLIVEDDVNFANILLDRAREKGFKGVVTTRGASALALAKRYTPNAITLDISLPDMDGWAILDRLKHDTDTRHIPVHIISASEEPLRGLKQGALAYLHKPVTKEGLDDALAHIKGFIDRKMKRLLVVEDNEIQRNSILELIGNGDVVSTAVGTGAEALKALKAETFDCMVIDLGLPDMTGLELIKKIRKEAASAELPIIIYTGKELTKKQETELRRLADTIILKDVKSLDRLLDETTLFLHRVQANLPAPKRELIEQSRQPDAVLSGKKVLVVDDDMRNIFALTGLLERHQMEVLFAESGKDSIEMLQNHPDVDILLMDVMMPDMDGYETTRAIRQMPEFKSLPIIALTAKAMKGDREKCIEAGASDYIAKPVDTDQLLSLLRVWLYK
ncbi:MAG: HAMP domain-containing protein [Armatimonadetes bacterium]|nr:HAMP domain-containing protein [Armatimonadota bacterium]